MIYHFSNKISAARIATFVSTAAWIQGTSASEVSLPEEALNNFLKRHGALTVSPRQTNGTEEEDGKDEKEGEDSGDSLSSSSIDAPGAPPSVSTDSDSNSAPSLPDSPQAGLAQGASGQSGIGSPRAPALSTGAKVAIGVWSAVGVFAIAGLIFSFYMRRRRRARLAQEQVNAIRDEELARSQQAMSQRMSGPNMGTSFPPPPQSVVMKPVYLGGGSVGAPSIRASSIARSPSVRAPGEIARDSSIRAPTVREPSGQWMPVPPWQEDPPTWRDSQPWRQSQPSVVCPAPIGLPSSVRPIVSLQTTKPPELDRRTEYTADTESTIFAYR
ncbi:hypothetical protein GGR53DRAFT_170113 [Hypoxylon sp. FL1150]|nr:hypothetical protein GGR53DRAFT_170113 [Hypoxylon sp. FL1150]